MKRAITVITDNFSDWETALINSTCRGYYGFDVRFAAPQGAPVISSSGMLVTPQLPIEAIPLDEINLLIICGGTAWQTEHAPNISGLVADAHRKNIVVAGICDGTRVLAQAGVLDNCRHTSNSAENLSSVSGYRGEACYQDVPYAVADQRVVTAPGSAPVSFMTEILAMLGISDSNIQAYQAMHAAEHSKPA